MSKRSPQWDYRVIGININPIQPSNANKAAKKMGENFSPEFLQNSFWRIPISKINKHGITVPASDTDLRKIRMGTLPARPTWEYGNALFSQAKPRSWRPIYLAKCCRGGNDHKARSTAATLGQSAEVDCELRSWSRALSVDGVGSTRISPTSVASPLARMEAKLLIGITTTLGFIFLRAELDDTPLSTIINFL